MDDETRKRLDDLWVKNAIASESLQRIVDAQARLAERQLFGIKNPDRAAALWASYEEALKCLLKIGDDLQQAAQDAGLLPKTK